MSLLREYIRRELAEIHRNGIRLQILGRYEQLPHEVLQDLEDALRQTASNKGMVLNVALNYSARTELVDAFHAIYKKLQQNGTSAAPVTEQTISDHLYTSGLPDPDLLIRTSGEMRLSNFLLWQLSYTEFYVTQTLWPDFRKPQLIEAIREYTRRDRRFGGVK
jgi:undecaprenyl diphosphate synthase